MPYSLTIRLEAEHDIDDAFSYYENIRVGLGHDFLLCVEEALSKVSTNPLRYRVVYEQLRKVVINRYPYRIFYFVKEKSIIVTAVFHVRKSPKEWDSRIQ